MTTDPASSSVDLEAIERRLFRLEANTNYVDDWIEWDDVRVLLAEVARLQAQVAAMREVVEAARLIADDEFYSAQHYQNLRLAVARLDGAAPGETRGKSYQGRVHPWLLECFGPTIATDRVERHHRFLEEALELVQATGCTVDEAHQLVEYVYGRPPGEVGQEVGGVMVTLAALCLAHGLDMHAAGEAELARVWTRVEQIRAKQAAKPKYGETRQL